MLKRIKKGEKMNFRYIPELEWRWRYPLVLFTMVGIGISMLLYFRRKKGQPHLLWEFYGNERSDLDTTILE